MSVVMQHSGVWRKQEDPETVLYEAALRSLSRARQSIAEDDCIGRIMEVKKVTDILTCLQATQRMRLGRSATVSLSDFYAAMFTLTLEASQCESVEGLDEVIHCVARVRDAWMLSTEEAKTGKTMPRSMQSLQGSAGEILAYA